VRVVHPSELMREAAVVLEPVRDDIVIIGAVAVQIALDGHQVALAATRDIDVALTLTPTRDIDAGVKTDAVHRVVARLEEIGLRRSDVPHEHSFTWVKGDLKVQLLRPFDPFPKGSAKGLPVSNIIPELHAHRVAVAFDDTPDTFRFWAASAAALIGLKEAAFGRTRPGGEPVDRDFSDVAMLLEQTVRRDRRGASRSVTDARTRRARRPTTPEQRSERSSGARARQGRWPRHTAWGRTRRSAGRASLSATHRLIQAVPSWSRGGHL
jgi:hypothetical protein